MLTLPALGIYLGTRVLFDTKHYSYYNFYKEGTLRSLFISGIIYATCILSASAQTSVLPSGSGTPANPYLIASINNLYWVTQDTSRWSKVYRQTANINAATTSTWDGGKGFLPIGNISKFFTGSYDGGSFTISNLFINRTATGVECHVGLFGLANGFTFSNIKLSNVMITGNTDVGSAYVGALIGYAHAGSITNCSSAGSVSSPQLWASVGGLVGYQEYATTVTNCFSSCTVTSTGENAAVGGLIGVEDLACVVISSYCTGKVTVPSNSYHAVGGLVGEERSRVYNAKYCSIVNCYSTSAVSGGTVVGGLVGIQQSGTTVTNCYSTGTITGSTGPSIGGLIGMGEATVSASFWDVQTSGRATSSGGTGKTTSEMKTAATFVTAGWEGTVWNIDAGFNNGYPYLDWQNPNGTPLTTGGVTPGTITLAPFSNLIIDISENHPKVNIQYQRTVSSGTFVHAVWCESDTVDGISYRYLAYRRSIDGGRTFEGKKYLGSLTKIADPKGTQYVAVYGATVHIIIVDCLPSSDSVSNRLLYFRSTDNGATFEAPKTVWSLNRNIGNAVGDYYLLANGGVVSIFRSVNPDYYAKDPVVSCYSSVDNGATFAQPSTLTLLPKGKDGWWYWVFSDAVSQGSTLYALASDYDKVNQIDRLTFVKSTDGGKTFTFSPVTIANGSSSIPDIQWNYGNVVESFHNKKMSIENSDVHIIWDQKDVGSSQYDLFYRKSTNSGGVFSVAKNLTSTRTRDDNHFGSAAIVSKGNYVYITYNYHSNNWKIGVYYSKDKGETFNFIDLTNDSLFYAADARNAVPMIDPSSIGDRLFVTYAVNQNWNQNISLTRFNATSGIVSRKYYFPTMDFSYISAPTPTLNADGSVHVLVHGTWPGMYAPRHLYSLVIEKEKSASIDNYAVRFDHGSGSQLDENMQIPYSANIAFTSAMTIEGWVKKISDGQLLVAGKKGKDQDYDYYLGVSQNSNASNPKHPFASITTSTQKYDLSGNNADSVWKNRWQHIAMTYDMSGGTNNFKLYLNGKVIDQTTATGTIVNGSGCIFVNHMPNGGWSYPMGSALYDELRFWNKAKSETEIFAAMSNPLAGTESGLAAYYPLNETLREATGKGEDAIFNYTGFYEKSIFPFITGVKNISTVPDRCLLGQNFPNPFNPSTVIAYQIAVSDHVVLKVYDVLGKEAATLVDEPQAAGAHEITFDAARIASGVYFYRLQVGAFVASKKLVVLK